MTVFVYRSLKKNGYYLYVPEKGNFEKVPESLTSALGQLEFALHFELVEGRKLATEDPQKVMDNLKNSGYHLQMTDPLLTPHIPDKTPISK